MNTQMQKELERLEFAVADGDLKMVSQAMSDFRKGDAAPQAEPRSHLKCQTHGGVHSEIQFHRV